MTMQFAAVLKSPATDIAFVGTLLGVDPPMHLQIFLYAKHFMAELALERPFASVGAVVTNLGWSNNKLIL